jgi:nickel-dependent lactate racemase
MTIVKLAYGESGLELAIDDSKLEATIITPKDPPPLRDAHGAFKREVAAPLGAAPPLAELAASKGREIRSVAIVIADHTRPVPDRLLVPWIVEELGIPDSAITIIVGTGTHRGSNPAELERMLGKEALNRFRVVNHDCNAKDLVQVGKSACGGECWLNPLWVKADLRIATGFIEPHFYAGFSGGSKAVVPGIAGLKTVQHFHRASLIAHPQTTWGDVRANPLQALTREMLALCPPDFIVNVTLNLKKDITGVFAGEVRAAHDAGCAHALGEAMVPVTRTFPVVVTTNSGYPLDQNFYQTVKGISAAARIVAPGGTILVASECRVGLPPEGEFGKILSDQRTRDQLHESIKRSERTRHDQWQVQTLLQCLEKSRVVLHSKLSPENRRLTRTEHGEDINASLAACAAGWKGGGRMPVAVLPMGPLTIPFLQTSP